MLHVYMKASNLISQLPDILHNISYTNVTPDNQKGEKNRTDTVTCLQPLRFKIEHDKHTNAIFPEMICVFFSLLHLDLHALNLCLHNSWYM